MASACDASRTLTEFVNLDWALNPGRCPGLGISERLRRWLVKYMNTHHHFLIEDDGVSTTRRYPARADGSNRTRDNDKCQIAFFVLEYSSNDWPGTRPI